MDKLEALRQALLSAHVEVCWMPNSMNPVVRIQFPLPDCMTHMQMYSNPSVPPRDPSYLEFCKAWQEILERVAPATTSISRSAFGLEGGVTGELPSMLEGEQLLVAVSELIRSHLPATKMSEEMACGQILNHLRIERAIAMARQHGKDKP